MKRIGVMLDGKVIRRALQGKPTYERLSLYVKIGKELGLYPVFFHPLDVSLPSRRVRGYVWNGDRLVRHAFRLPAVIHNRVLSGHRGTNAMIRRLSRIARVYNGPVPRDKAKVYQLLWKNRALRPYLPETDRYAYPKLERMLRRHPVVYVKPAWGAVGIGVARLKRLPDGRLEMVSSRKRWQFPVNRLRREAANWVKGRKFIVQAGILLAKYEGQPFDIRVSVQKGGAGRWVVSGMVAKVANPRNQLSNLAQGGRAVPLDRALSARFDSEEIVTVKQRLAAAALAIAAEFGRHHPKLADLGLDMGVDEAGHPYLIEANIRDQRYSFYKAGETEMFHRTYRHPMEYGKYLLERG